MTVRMAAAGLLVAGALASIGVGVASGGGVIPTTIKAERFNDSDGDGVADYIHGRLESAKRRCLANRTVKLLIGTPGSLRLRDQSRSSRRGYWAVGGENVSGFGRVVVTRKRLRGGRICGRDHDDFD